MLKASAAAADPSGCRHRAASDHQGVTEAGTFSPVAPAARTVRSWPDQRGVRERTTTRSGVSDAQLRDPVELDRPGRQEQPRYLKRAKAFRALIENRRGKVREHLYTLGEYDILTVAEFPDDETATAAVLTLASLGNVRVKTLRAFTDQ